MTKLSTDEANGIPVAFLLSIAAGLLLLLHFYTPANSGQWKHAFFESLHVPVFGIVAVCCYWIASLITNWTVRRRFLIALSVAAALGALSEVAQITGPRDASADDIIADVLGAAAGLFLIVALATRDTIDRTPRFALAMAGVAVGTFAMWPIIGVSAAYLERNMQRPVLLSFDARYGHAFRRIQNASLRIERHPDPGRSIAKITLGDGAWPGIILKDVWPDWRDYSSLVIELGLDDAQPLEINVRVHDRQHLSGEQPYHDRFNIAYRLQPGQHSLRVPIESIRNAPRDRSMDMSQMEGIVVFCVAGNTGREFLLNEIRLE